MPNWFESMQQTFEYYIVDPGTWRDVKPLDNVKSCTISRDIETETLGSATIDVVDSLGECYVRVYLITIQNGVKEKHPLGTFLVQTPSSTFNGKAREVSMDAYTPLIELKENSPPLGYSLLKDLESDQNIMNVAYRLTRDQVRAPVVETTNDTKLQYDFVAQPDDSWLGFIADLIANAKHEFMLDEMGRILFAPKQDAASLQPIVTFDDGNSSILYPELTINHDLYDIPNVVEVLCSSGGGYYYAKAVNDDPNSPTSIQSRGRVISRRITDPDLGNPTQSQVDEYAEQALKELSTVEYSVSFTHGYYPVRIGDCIRLNYSRAGITDTKAKIISQSIKCTPGCPVTTKAIFTTKLWG